MESNYRTTFLFCRMIGHAWRQIGAIEIEKASVYVIRLRCMNCDARRKDRIRSNGELDGRLYQMPDRYLIKGNINRTRTPFRREFMRRRT
jgi:hypothetical protein